MRFGGSGEHLSRLRGCSDYKWREHRDWDDERRPGAVMTMGLTLWKGIEDKMGCVVVDSLRLLLESVLLDF